MGIHDTPARAAYVGASRYCESPTSGYTHDGGVRTNRYAEVVDNNLPAAWKARCADPTYAYTFGVDCRCAAFRGSQANALLRNTFARIGSRRDRVAFADGAVYVSGLGAVLDHNDAMRFEDNMFLATPGPGAPFMRLLYVDGYTGSMNINRNGASGVSSTEGFAPCTWYGHTPTHSNVLDGNFPSRDVYGNCDGNPIVDLQGNLILSNQGSATHDPQQALVADYEKVYRNMCAAGHRSGAVTQQFLSRLAVVITNLGGTAPKC